MLDPKVDIFMSRDLDSAILPREVCVQIWKKAKFNPLI